MQIGLIESPGLVKDLVKEPLTCEAVMNREENNARANVRD